MSWRDLLNVQNVEKGFFVSSNSYGIPDMKADEFDIKELIPYRVDSNRNGTAHFSWMITDLRDVGKTPTRKFLN